MIVPAFLFYYLSICTNSCSLQPYPLRIGTSFFVGTLWKGTYCYMLYAGSAYVKLVTYSAGSSSPNYFESSNCATVRRRLYETVA